MSKKQKAQLSLLAGIIVIFFMVRFIAKNWHDFRELQFSQPLYFAPLIVFVVANLYANGNLMSSQLKSLNIHLSTVESMGMSVLNRFANYIAPLRLGASVRVVYLKKKYNLSVTHFLSSIMAIYIIQFLISSLFGVLALAYLWQTNQAEWNFIGTGLGILFFGLLVAVFLTPTKFLRFVKPTNRLSRLIHQFVDGWETIRRDKTAMQESTVWSVLTFLTFSVMTFCLFRVLGEQMNIFEAVFVTASGTLAALVGITPGGIGVNEGLVVVAASALGYSPVVSLAAALIQRFVVFVTVAVLAPYYSARLFPRRAIMDILKGRKVADGAKK